MSRGLIHHGTTAVEKTERRPSDRNPVQTVPSLHSDLVGRRPDSPLEDVDFQRRAGPSQGHRSRSVEGCKMSRPSAAAVRSALGRGSKRNSDWGPVSDAGSRAWPPRPQRDRCFRGQSRRGEMAERHTAEKAPAGS